MGREARRVPLDFDWPLQEVWEGYLLPDRLRVPACSDCAGRGYSTARQWVEACAHMILMLDDDLRDQARGRPMHPYFREFYTTAYGTRPSSDITQLATGLAGREGGPLGHDACDGWAATKKIIEAAGLNPDEWGICTTCAGSGEAEAYPGQSAEAEAWTPTEPPTGDGWQMWETVSEGSPMSPVFPTAEELAAWLAGSGASLFGTKHTATREQWLKIITGEDVAHVELAPGVWIM